MNISGIGLLGFILAYTITLPAIMAIVRVRKIDRKFIPFLIIMMAGLATELAYEVEMRMHPDAIDFLVYKIYLIVENLLYLWLFRNLGILQPVKIWVGLSLFNLLFYTYYILANDKMDSGNFGPYMLFGFQHLFFSILLMSRQILVVNKPLMRNPLFLLALPLTVYFAFVVLQVGITYWLENNTLITNSAMTFQKIMNAICNLFFVYTILCLPRHRTYSPSSS